MTDQELLTQQEALQQEAHQVIAGLHLLEELALHGHPKIVGSVDI